MFFLFLQIFALFTYSNLIVVSHILPGKPWLGGTQGDAPGKVKASPGGVETNAWRKSQVVDENHFGGAFSVQVATGKNQGSCSAGWIRDVLGELPGGVIIMTLRVVLSTFMTSLPASLQGWSSPTIRSSLISHEQWSRKI